VDQVNSGGVIMVYMNTVKQCSNKCLMVLLLFFSFNANASNQVTNTTTIDSTHYRVSFKSRVEPLPLNKIHSWVLHIDTLDGKPVEKARVSVYGGMPAHKHGLPTEPVVSELSRGDYLVEGLKFSMSGDWEIWFNIRTGNITDKVKFKITF